MQVLSTCSSHWYAFTCHIWKMRRKIELVLLLLLEIVVVTWFTQWKSARNLVKSFWNRISVSWRILKWWKFIPSEMWGKMIILEFSAWHFLGKVIQMHLNLMFWRINSKCPIWMKVSFHINIKTSSAAEENCWWRIKIGWIFMREKMRKQFCWSQYFP